MKYIKYIVVLVVVIFIASYGNPSTSQEIIETKSGTYELIVPDSIKLLYPERFKNKMILELREDLTLKINEGSPFWPGSEGEWWGAYGDCLQITLTVDDALNEDKFMFNYKKDTMRMNSFPIYDENYKYSWFTSIPNCDWSLFKKID